MRVKIYSERILNQNKWDPVVVPYFADKVLKVLAVRRSMVASQGLVYSVCCDGVRQSHPNGLVFSSCIDIVIYEPGDGQKFGTNMMNDTFYHATKAISVEDRRIYWLKGEAWPIGADVTLHYLIMLGLDKKEPPVSVACDCGAVKCKTTHAFWCSTRHNQ